jgi:titin
LFANRVIQQTTFDKGWKNRIILEEGVHTGAGAMTYAPNYYSASDGAVETTTNELDALIASVPNRYPDPPTNVSAALVSGNILVSFVAPRYQGETPVTSYTVISNPGGVRVSGTASPITTTGLTPGFSYTFTVIARNSAGNSVESAASNSITPGNVPGIPTNFAVAPGAETMNLYFTAPADDGGSPITNYMYSTDNGVSYSLAGSTSSPITVGGVLAGSTYDFKLKAVNAIGAGDPTSALSAAGLAAFNPNDIAGINVWLDSQVQSSVTISGGRVTAMADQSSAGNNFTASVTGTITYDFPSGINGRPGLNFTTSGPATSTYLSKSANLGPTEQMTVFLVVRQTGTGASGNSELFFTRNNFQYFDIFNRTNDDGILFACVKGSPPSLDSGVDIITSPPTNALISFVTDATAYMYVNGATTAINNSARGTALSLNAALDWSISGAAFLGNYGEVMCFSTPLNTTQRQAVEGYLAWKWGMQGSLPGAHPYSSAPPALALPAAPTSLVATPADGSASIAFTAGSNGGSAITNYQYSTDNGSTFTAFSPTQTSSPVTISGLTNGTAYNVKLKAVTDFGVGEASAAVSVTPAVVITGSPRVLILGNSAVATLATALQSAKTDMGYAGTMTFTTKNVFGVDSSYTGADISAANYDVVILYGDGGSTPSSTLGANLDTYVTNGGRFIMGVYAWGNVPSFPGLTFANSSTYVYAGTQNYIGGSAIATDVSHPILTGINGALSISGGFTSAITLTSGSTSIASFSNGTSFLAVRTPGSAKLVGMNIYPVVSWSPAPGNNLNNILRYMVNSIYWCIGSLT